VNAWARGGLAVLLGGIFIAALTLVDPDGSVVLIVSDGGQLAAAAIAAFACSWSAWRSRGRQRRSWTFLAVGTGSWAAGQMVWTYYEVVLDVEVPFPSAADVGFLIFPLFAVFGLLSWSSAPGRLSAQARDLLDGAIIAGSLLVLSWATTLGSVVGGGGDGWLSITLSVAYPLADVILATVVLLTLGRIGAGGRATLFLVVSGVGCLAIADSAYGYLVAVGRYSSGDLVTSGWVFGFLLIAAGASLSATAASRESDRSSARERQVAPAAPARVQLLLPYIPLMAAITTLYIRLVAGSTTPEFDLTLGSVLVTLVMFRQFLAMNENYRLLSELEIVRDQLQHQALHDPLTGLANRRLFTDRVEHAFAQRSVDVTLLYCDLDDFKTVNDEFGHQAGDSLLQTVAQRLLECVRPGDTVARLGGDEFALLIEDASNARQVAERIVASIQEPCPWGDTTVRTSVSVGIASHQVANETRVERSVRASGAEHLIKEADSAMYVAKASGKAQVVDALTMANRLPD